MLATFSDLADFSTAVPKPNICSNLKVKKLLFACHHVTDFYVVTHSQRLQT